MVTRSIVGRVLILAVLIVSLGVMAQAALIITHGPAKKNGTVQPGDVRAAADQQDTAPIRVVYPGPLGDTPAPARKIADAAPASPLASATPASPPSLTSSSVGAIAQASASQEDFDTGEQTAATPSPVAAALPATASNVGASPAAPTTPAVEVASIDPVIPNTPVSSQQTAESSARGVNINSASAAALDHLQGGGRIGLSIVQHRPYKSVDDLVKKRVLRRAVYDQIKNQIAAQ